MNDLRETAKLALEALEYLAVTAQHKVDDEVADQAIAALKRALANDAMDKMAENARELGLDYGCLNCANLMEQNTELDKKLSEWVGLTEEEYKELHLQMGAVYFYQDYGRAIEAKLKERNT